MYTSPQNTRFFATGNTRKFSPNRLSGLTSWFDASTTSIYQDGAVQFTKADKAYLDIVDNAALSMGAGVDFTIAGWIYVDSSAAALQQFIVGKSASLSTASAIEYMIYIDAANKPNFAVSDGTTRFAAVWGSAISTSTWYFVSATLNTTTGVISLDINNSGTPVTTSSVTYAQNAANDFTVGGSTHSIGYWFDGRQDSLGIWKRVLTAAELTTLYNAGAGQMFSDLTTAMKVSMVAWYGFNEEDGIRYDQYGTNHLTPVFTAIISPTVLNGGFETLGGGGADVFANWTENATGTSVIAANAVAPYAGTYDAMFTVDASGNYAEVLQTVLTVGKKYSVSFYAKASSGTPNVIVYFGNGKFLTQAITTSYALYTLYATCATNGILEIVVAAASITFNIDNITVTATEIQSNTGIAAGQSIDGNLCASFNGSTQSLSKASNATLVPDTSNFSVFGWVNLSAIGTTQLFITKANGAIAGTSLGYWLSNASGGTVFNFVVTKSGGSSIGASAVATVPNTWYFLVGTWDNDKARLYVNDALAGTGGSLTATLNNTNALTLGSSAAGPHRMDGVGFIKRVLTAGEMTSLFNNGKGVKYAGLPSTVSSDSTLSFWNLDEFSAGTGAVTRLDSSANANNLTDTGTTPSGQGVDYFEGTISKLVDLSASAKNLTQTTQSQKGLYRTNIQNGKAVTTWDALTKTVSNSNDLIGAGNVTVFAVMKPIGWGGGGAGRIIDNSKFLIRVQASTIGFSSDGTITEVTAGVGALSLGTAYTVIVTRTSAGVANIYINGTLSGTADQASGTPAAGTPTYLGNNAAGARGFDGDIDDVGVYNSILTTSQITLLNSYLRSKWGI